MSWDMSWLTDGLSSVGDTVSDGVGALSDWFSSSNDVTSAVNSGSSFMDSLNSSGITSGANELMSYANNTVDDSDWFGDSWDSISDTTSGIFSGLNGEKGKDAVSWAELGTNLWLANEQVSSTNTANDLALKTYENNLALQEDEQAVVDANDTSLDSAVSSIFAAPTKKKTTATA